MAGKFGIALIRREANTYRSHGLPEEARNLYKKLLSSSPYLPPEIKRDIEYQLQLIELEIRCVGSEECETLSNEQLSIIQQGWSGQGTVAEILACAESLYHVGRFGEALEELKKLRHRGGAPRGAIALITACLIQQHGSDDLPTAVDRWAGEFFQDPKAVLSFHVAIAEKTLEWRRLEHTRSEIRHVRRYQGLPPEVQERISALTGEFTGSSSIPKPRLAARTDAQADHTRFDARPVIGRIRETAKSFKRKLRSRSQTTQWPSPQRLRTLSDECRPDDIRQIPS
jgi:tetratricopeptide (TPR) repeat protein